MARKTRDEQIAEAQETLRLARERKTLLLYAARRTCAALDDAQQAENRAQAALHRLMPSGR